MAASSARAARVARLSAALAGPRAQALAFALAAALLAWRALARLAAAWPFATDDAYITLRYARHLLAGEGLVWNRGGAPVEGFSNLLWLLLAAGYGLLGELDIGPLKLLGALGLVMTGYLQWAIARRFVAPLPALLPFALLILVRGSFWWAVSGLETGAYMASACAVVLASLRGLGFGRVELGPGEWIGCARGPLAPVWLGVAGGLCLLASALRPEGPLLAAAVLVALGAQRWRDGAAAVGPSYGRALRAFALGFGPGLAALIGWRWASFAALVPNTVRCKTGHADAYVLLRAYWATAPVTLVAALIQPLRELDARVVLPAAIALGYALALIGADPVVGHEVRHFLAAHALVCVLASVAAVRLAALVAGRLGPRAAELLLVAALLVTATPLGGLAPRDELRDRANGYAARSAVRAELGRELAATLEPGQVAVLGDVGVAGWTGDAAILDAFCLNEPALARPPLQGDDAARAAWILDQEPALIVVHTRSKTAIEPRGQVYRELVADPRFAARYREQRRFNGERGSFHYVVFARLRP